MPECRFRPKECDPLFSLFRLLWFDLKTFHHFLDIEWIESIGSTRLEHNGIESGKHLGPLEANETIRTSALIRFVDHPLFLRFREREHAVGFRSLNAAI